MRLLAVLLVAIAPPAAAAPQVPPAPSASADPAREHYERGLAKYNLAEFDAAIAEFKQSYELSKAPRLLFNIAQAYRLKKDYESALYFYSTYLRSEPNPPNLGDVEEKIDEMKRAVDDQRKQVMQQLAPPPPQPLPPSPPERRISKRTLKIVGISALSLGVAAAATGGGMFGLASSDANKLKRVASQGWAWNSADDAIYREGERSQTAAIALVSVGGALVVAGGITLVVALRR
jgi:tetratricopeptide (TPR) repeat protein